MKNNLDIKLKRELLKDKKGKTVHSEEESVYRQEDSQALMQITAGFDSRKHSWKDYKQFMKLREQIDKAWVKEEQKLELSLDEASILKTFLHEFFDKDAKEEDKGKVSIFLGRTIISVLEQLEE